MVVEAEVELQTSSTSATLSGGELRMDIAFNAIGLMGVALILLAYFLLQRDALTARCMAYLLLNLLGASLILVSLVRDWNLAAFVIEASWVAVSLYGIAKTIKQRG